VEDELDVPGRRGALKGIGAATLAPLLPGCGGGGGEVPEEIPALSDGLIRDRIDTVVVLMMENRSFDHYLGALSLLEGREDVDGLVEGMSNPHPDGGVVEIHAADANCIEDPPHSWSSSHRQFGDGTNDGFVQEHHARHGAEEAHRVMGYFDRETLSSFYALADVGTVFSRWFCSLMTSTWPNRFYSIAAQSGGQYGNDLAGNRDWPSIFDRLDEAGIPWTNYYGNIPFSILMPSLGLGDERLRHIEDFFDDAERGTLPSLVWLDPVYGRNCDHPPTHPVAGQVLVSSIYEALANSPQWDRCLFLVTYDEHGGFFDHVPPPLAVDERSEDGFDQLGFRVPTLAVGPWVKAGHSFDEVCDHTSVLAFLERLWSLQPLTARDEAADDLFGILDERRLVEDDPAPPTKLPVIEATDEELYAPECSYEINMRSELEGDAAVSGQHELEALLDGPLAGAEFDRREQTDEIYERLLSRAAELGVLQRKG
jgi:phospholipase C